MDDLNENGFGEIIFPFVKNVVNGTLGGGYYTKSPAQKVRQDRINKLQALEDKPPIELENDVFVDGIQPIKPIYGPIGKLLYIDYIYEPINDKKMKKYG